MACIIAGGEIVECQRVDLLEILLAEQNQLDQETTARELERAKIRNRLHVVRNGLEALRFLHKQRPFGDVPKPDVLLLNLSIPRVDGWEIIETMRQTPELADIKVAVLTDEETLHGLHRELLFEVQCVLQKPVTFAQLHNMVQSFDDFGFGIIRCTKPATEGTHGRSRQPGTSRPREIREFDST